MRKHVGVLLPYDFLGTRGLMLTNCGKNDLEISSVSWLPIEVLKGISASKGDSVNKCSVKSCNKFAQWLKHNKVITMRDFKVASQCRWQYDENADKFYIKMDNGEHDEHVNDESKLRRKVHKHKCKKQQLGLNCFVQ